MEAMELRICRFEKGVVYFQLAICCKHVPEGISFYPIDSSNIPILSPYYIIYPFKIPSKIWIVPGAGRGRATRGAWMRIMRFHQLHSFAYMGSHDSCHGNGGFHER